MTVTARIDRQTQVVDGVTFTNTHSGQKRAYGDRFYEYTAESGMAPEHVEQVLCEHAYKCRLPKSQWLAENRANPSMSNHFRSHYEFEDLGDGKFFYRVTFPFTD